MKILIEGRQSIGGLERYTQNLIRLLSSDLTDDEIMIFGQSAAAHPADTRKRGAVRAALGDFRRVFTEQYLIPRAARERQAALFHSTNYFVPRRLSIPCVATCHDLWLLDHLREKKPGWTKHYERWQLCDGLRRADHVIAVSNTVARAIETRFGYGPERISVVYPPICDLGGVEIPDITPVSMGKRFFLAVGTLEPRKNFDCVLEGHRLAYRECGIPLYLAGAYGWNQKALVRRIRESRGAARWLGGVPDSTLAALYRQAVALIAFGRDEGFDYPSVEALSLGTPVILSDIPVHREIVGHPGLYAPPDEPEALGRNMLEAAAMSAPDRAKFRDAARERIGALRRRGSAKRYREIYRRVVG